MHSNHPCIVSGGVREPSLSVLQIYLAGWILDLDHFDTYPAGVVLNLQCFGGGIVPAKILGPSECGADYRSSTMVMHDCAPIARMSVVRVPTCTPAPSATNGSRIRLTRKKVQLKLDAFPCPPSPSNTPARKSCTQKLFCSSRAEHASQQAVPGFVVHMSSCLHDLFRVACPLHSNWGAREPSLGVCSLGGARIPSRSGNYCARGRGVEAVALLSLLSPHNACCPWLSMPHGVRHRIWMSTQVGDIFFWANVCG